jgi:hypothetical protein
MSTGRKPAYSRLTLRLEPQSPPISGAVRSPRPLLIAQSARERRVRWTVPRRPSQHSVRAAPRRCRSCLEMTATVLEVLAPVGSRRASCREHRLYEGGRVVNGAGGGRVRARARVGGERRSCLYRPVGSRGLGVIGGLVRRCMSIVSRQAARRKGAPAGAKGSLRVSMCQIASVSRRERSIWATLGPRWRPRRRLVCW